MRYPVNGNSRLTLERALEEAGDDGDVVVLHVNLYQTGQKVSRGDLRREVEPHLDGKTADVYYAVRRGFMVEEAILEEAVNSDVDVVVVGKTRAGRLRRAIRRLMGNDPEIEDFLSDHFDARIEVVG